MSPVVCVCIKTIVSLMVCIYTKLSSLWWSVSIQNKKSNKKLKQTAIVFLVVCVCIKTIVSLVTCVCIKTIVSQVACVCIKTIVTLVVCVCTNYRHSDGLYLYKTIVSLVVCVCTKQKEQQKTKTNSYRLSGGLCL